MTDPFNFIFDLTNSAGIIAFLVVLFLLWLGGWFVTGRPLLGFITSLIAGPMLSIMFIIYYLTFATLVGPILTDLLDAVSAKTIAYILSAICTTALYLHYIFSSRRLRYVTAHSVRFPSGDGYNAFAHSPGTRKISTRR